LPRYICQGVCDKGNTTNLCSRQSCGISPGAIDRSRIWSHSDRLSSTLPEVFGIPGFGHSNTFKKIVMASVSDAYALYALRVMQMLDDTGVRVIADCRAERPLRP
jgi:hypothetical protein